MILKIDSHVAMQQNKTINRNNTTEGHTIGSPPFSPMQMDIFVLYTYEKK